MVRVNIVSKVIYLKSKASLMFEPILRPFLTTYLRYKHLRGKGKTKKKEKLLLLYFDIFFLLFIKLLFDMRLSATLLCH